MTYHLICIEHFGAYAKGDKITAPDQVAMVLASPQHTHVVKVVAPAPSVAAASEDHDE